MPDVVKEQQGTLKKCRVNQSQPKFAVPESMPKPPMTLNTFGKRLWKEMIPRLVETGVYTEADHAAFELLCMAYSDLREARLALQTSGTTVKSRTGAYYQHPNVGIANQAWLRVKTMLGQFGLTPAERSHVKGLSPSNKGKSLADALFAEARAKVEGGEK